jgi:aspartate/tyrosine/aromatic aminotransferase
MEMCVAQSFSKNFGLYGQRVGAFHYVTNRSSTSIRDIVVNNLCHLIRGEFSMGPRVGCSIVKKVLTSDELTADWHQDLQVMSSRIKAMRQALYNELVRLQTPGTWEHIIQQVSCEQVYLTAVIYTNNPIERHVLLHRPLPQAGLRPEGQVPHLSTQVRPSLHQRL